MQETGGQLWESGLGGSHVCGVREEFSYVPAAKGVP